MSGYGKSAGGGGGGGAAAPQTALEKTGLRWQRQRRRENLAPPALQLFFTDKSAENAATIFKDIFGKDYVWPRHLHITLDAGKVATAVGQNVFSTISQREGNAVTRVLNLEKEAQKLEGGGALVFGRIKKNITLNPVVHTSGLRGKGGRSYQVKFLALDSGGAKTGIPDFVGRFSPHVVVAKDYMRRAAAPFSVTRKIWKNAGQRMAGVLARRGMGGDAIPLEIKGIRFSQVIPVDQKPAVRTAVGEKAGVKLSGFGEDSVGQRGTVFITIYEGRRRRQRVRKKKAAAIKAGATEQHVATVAAFRPFGDEGDVWWRRRGEEDDDEAERAREEAEREREMAAARMGSSGSRRSTAPRSSLLNTRIPSGASSSGRATARRSSLLISPSWRPAPSDAAGGGLGGLGGFVPSQFKRQPTTVLGQASKKTKKKKGDGKGGRKRKTKRRKKRQKKRKTRRYRKKRRRRTKRRR